MSAVASPTSPSKEWLDRKEYPFGPKYLSVEGGRMHYIDEGEGDPIVFVHGNPTWSFYYRKLIRDLSFKHRCIAMDHIGFGLSDKPADWSYTPEAHSRNVAKLINHLGLTNISFVVHGFGGPIGLSYALDAPAKVRSLVIMNSWLWSLKSRPDSRKLETMGKSPLSKLTLFQSCMKSLIPEKQKVTSKVIDQYVGPLKKPMERNGPVGLCRGMIGSSPWLYDLYARREALADKSALLLWGMKDRLATPDDLVKWQQMLPNSSTEMLPKCGHFILEEDAADVEAAIYLFLDGQKELQGTARSVLDTLTD